MVDPLEVMTKFMYTVLDLHIFSNEGIIKAVERALPGFGHRNPVFVHIRGENYLHRFRCASFVSSPNGEEIRCCGRFPKYVRCDLRRGKVIFRCRQAHHFGKRGITVYLGKGRFIPGGGGPRFIEDLT